MMPDTKTTATVFPGTFWEEKSSESQNADSQKLEDAISFLVLCDGTPWPVGTSWPVFHRILSGVENFQAWVPVRSNSPLGRLTGEAVPG